MNELQLVGYTADLRYLVFSDAAGKARFRTPVDGDLLETLNEILELVDPDQAAAFGIVAVPDHGADEGEEASDVGAPSADEVPGGEEGAGTTPGEPDDAEVAARQRGGPQGNGQGQRLSWPQPGQGGLAGAFLVRLPDPEPEPEPEPESLDAAGRGSKLSPREIQALLRAGMAPREVARAAETDEAWVQRWLPPIEAERKQIIAAVQRGQLVKARLGPSRDRLGEAVRVNLLDKGVEPDDESVVWNASRREGDPHWTVTLRYRSRGRRQRAVWRFRPERGELEPANTLAADIAWTRPLDKGGAKRRPAKKAVKKAGKKRSAKKAVKRAAARSGRTRR